MNRQQGSPTHLYVHVPFCRHRCGYCAFVVDTHFHEDERFKSDYVEACLRELDGQIERFSSEQLKSLYIGGGTPSRLSEQQITHLFEGIYDRLPGVRFDEITFELNPEDLVERPGLGRLMEELGVSRCSLGTQTTSPEGLKVLGRVPSVDQVRLGLAHLKESFRGSISCDLILGWPGQRLEMLLNDDLPFIKSENPDHLSIYLINIEPGTRLERDIKKGRLPTLDEEIGADLWEHLTTSMIQQGYEHYEISNFCRPGHASLHNTLTWRGEPYLGVGCGAVSRIGSQRWKNRASPMGYIKDINKSGQSDAEFEFLDGATLLEERMLLGLRHREGLDLSELEQLLGRALPPILEDSFAIGIAEGDLRREDSRLFFTQRGWSRFDAWVSSWMMNLESDEPS